jgi:hypothetical protein
MKKKKQHIVPNCYLKAWCDPTTPNGHEPYIWIHPADGGEPRRKSPKKTFTETDRYTIQSPSGDRDLLVEDTLAHIETEFARIRERVESVQQLSARDYFLLCAFVAAMCSRTKSAGDNWATMWDTVRSQARRRALEHSSIFDSPQLDDAVLNASGRYVQVTLKVLTPMLFHMRLGIYFVENRGTFITSDNPCVWYDRDKFRRPPAYRGPALSHPNVQILLALSPRSLLLLSHDKKWAGYFRADTQFIDEVNRLIRFDSHEHFVTHDGRSKPVWFEERGLPAHAWENTEEGKAIIAREEKNGKMYEQYLAERQAKRAEGEQQ